jgi:hypothetical protein
MLALHGGQCLGKDIRHARQRLGRSTKLAVCHKYAGSGARNLAPDALSRRGGTLFSLYAFQP